MAMHKMQQEGLPIVLIGAGLPVLPRLAGDSKSYAERLFDFPDIGPLPDEDAALAITDPIKDEGESILPEAVEEVVRITQGYPYFLQEWGYQSWNIADQSPIDVEDVDKASAAALRRLDDGFFKVRFERLSPKEREYVVAMASLGKGPYRSSDVADALGEKMTALGPRRAKIIHKGMIYSAAHGDIDFTVPMFDDFLRRHKSSLGA